MPRSAPQTEPIFIPAGHYVTKAQVAAQRHVIVATVQQWIDKGWLPSLHVPGLGHLINAADLAAFTPPKPGRHTP